MRASTAHHAADGKFVTLYKMIIRDIWSNPDASKIGKPVRYDFMSVESFDLTDLLGCRRLSDWMNTLHFYGRASLAESMMQDGEKAYYRNPNRLRNQTLPN